MDRPNFEDIKSYNEFAKYYWYREELQLICKNLGLEYREFIEKNQDKI